MTSSQRHDGRYATGCHDSRSRRAWDQANLRLSDLKCCWASGERGVWLHDYCLLARPENVYIKLVCWTTAWGQSSSLMMIRRSLYWLIIGLLSGQLCRSWGLTFSFYTKRICRCTKCTERMRVTTLHAASLFLTYPEHDNGFKGLWFTQLVPVASYRRRFNRLLLIWPKGGHLPIPSEPISVQHLHSKLMLGCILSLHTYQSYLTRQNIRYVRYVNL